MSINRPMKGSRHTNSILKDLRKKLSLVGESFTYREFEQALNKAKVFGEYPDSKVKKYIEKAESLRMIELIIVPEDPKEAIYRKIGTH